jgi:hypothetical protein
MAPVFKKEDDFVIQNRSNAATSGGWVENFVVTGPGIGLTGLPFQSRPEAEAEGRKRAGAASVSLWYEDRPQSSNGILLESYRQSN